jgi:hypothetical protein
MSLHKVTLIQSLIGQRIENVLHLRNADGALTNQQMADYIVANWIDVVRINQNNRLTYLQLLIQDADTPNVAPFVVNLASAGQWVGFDANLPFLSLVLKKNTNFAGRHGRGRVYLCGVNHGEISTTGAWDTGNLTGRFKTMTDNLNLHWTIDATGGLTLQVAPHNFSIGNEGHSVTNIQARAFPGVQRRRCVGVGV